MAKIEIKTVKLDEIKLNPDNPRMISKKDMNLLMKSLKDFPEMLQLREIVVDETMTVLGGNMRTLALRKAGLKKVTAKIVSGLTPEQKREFILKDNSSFGDWDMDALANAWGDLPLIDWGIDVSKQWTTEPTQEDQTSIMRKNFTDGMGVDEIPENDSQEIKYPVTFILDQSEWDRWEKAKTKLKIQDDKRAFLKIIGGA